MKVLLTGANGYIGTRLLPKLVEAGHHVVALVRSKQRFKIPKYLEKDVSIVEGNLLDSRSLERIPKDIDAAYYLVHSMGQKAEGFAHMEATCAENFIEAIENTQANQIIYLSGLSREEAHSEHMTSRHRVEKILRDGKASVTVLRAGIIIGSGSASFEILRELIEKLPLMIGPKWVLSLCQPIAIADVLFYLVRILGNPKCLKETFEIGGPETMTYKEMLLRLAKFRGLKRYMITIPLLTPYLSSLWLFFVTSTNFPLAQALVSSLTTNAVCTDQRIHEALPHQCLTFDEAVKNAFLKIQQNDVVSSWKDAIVQGTLKPHLAEYIVVPKHGCLKRRYHKSASVSKEEVLNHLWSIGGEKGWYYMNWAWTFRGLIDRITGGVGLKRGRRDPRELHSGDVLDWWRVLIADRDKGKLLLYAEMRLPGEAWLEWNVEGSETATTLTQTTTFRPKGILGRLYWYSLWPIHALIFRGMFHHVLRG